ncbi:hypothetical protein EV207_1785 [Scopulibacillus darangshiensis]|uniref:Uncharacterized protein n=1 Tax=Scopulibacillus darangshiensis TaxID=442528 RepID=A0A4R2N8X9_9BACL|nr:hypothetical protein [Scopulibacillus darangshiensis]TCP17442.1 hypothetical protein EV207_1785 [Scopulibacillus darangshiensis]
MEASFIKKALQEVGIDVPEKDIPYIQILVKKVSPVAPRLDPRLLKDVDPIKLYSWR